MTKPDTAKTPHAPQSLAGTTLDPADWNTTRAQGHRMLDDMFDFLENLRERPTWQPMTKSVRDHFKEPLPQLAQSLESVYEEFTKFILPYSSGNVHPGFMGWVQGGGTSTGMLAEMLAAGLNANLGGRDHAPIAVENQITQWMRQLFGFPAEASGLFVTGASMANLIAVLVARTEILGKITRKTGAGAEGAKLRAYASVAAHSCVTRAMDIAGLGSDALRLIPIDSSHCMDMSALQAAITADKKAGLEPFLVVGTAGTVDVGAIDDLKSIGALCRKEGTWFHVDGAFGALAAFSPELAPRLTGIEGADSIALDFHKWGQVPYDAGFVLVRDGVKHREAFATPAAYLRRETRGLAAGEFWPCDYGPDLSRGFRALKTWFTLKTYGTEHLGRMITGTCTLAQYLEKKILAEPKLELMAPVQLNIVCFRYRCDDSDKVNTEIVADIQESGIAAPSTTTINGKRAIRAALFNHRTQTCEVDALFDAVLSFGKKRDKT